jgi:hypothetical protein
MKNQPRSYSSTLRGSTVATLRPVHRVRAYLIGIVLGTSGLIMVPHVADAASPCGTGTLATPTTCMYSSNGSEQTFTVPAGVTSVSVVAIGGVGGPGISTGTGGFGAAVSGQLPTSPGATLFVEVGSNGVAAGGDSFNGGGSSATTDGTSGSGGGESDVRTVSMTDSATTLASRLLVAGGGGGGGGGEPNFNCPSGGGNGGDAGSNGDPATGGELAGQGGMSGDNGGGGGAGGGGTTSDGGNGGDGSPGQGGSAETNYVAAGCGGGGGGGGLEGGGAGGQGGDSNGVEGDGGGGGGGSSLVPSGGSATTDNTGTPSVTITWTPPPDHTQTTVTCPPYTDAVNSPASCTATVTDTTTPSTVPRGTVSWSGGSGSFNAPSCTLSSGACSVTFTPALGSEGTQQITGTYNAGASFDPSTGTAGIQVQKRTTATSVSCTPGPGKHPATQCTITVTDTSPGTAVTPSGIVRFTDSGATISPRPCTLSGGSCSITVTHWANGKKLTANYKGDADHSASHGSVKLRT